MHKSGCGSGLPDNTTLVLTVSFLCSNAIQCLGQTGQSHEITNVQATLSSLTVLMVAIALQSLF